MNDVIIISITLLSGLLVVYHHLGYPLVLRWLQRHRQQPHVTAPHRNYTESRVDNTLPSVCIVIPAYNEERWIADKIRNIAVLDYPVDRLSVIVACDGCRDATAAIARATAMEPECLHLAIEIREYEINRGKVAIINEVVENVSSEIVALSDVSALISVDALLIAAERFKDAGIGVLNGHYRLLNPGSPGEAAYWQYQGRIKASEAALGSTLGAHGAFYLFRRSLFKPIPADTINDDFILPMNIVTAGFRADYDGRIHALEQEKADQDMDQQRRRRIAAGNFQQLVRLKQLFLPRYGGVAFNFVSGKGLRVLMPFLMISALLGCIWLSTSYVFFAVLSAVQLLAYSLAAWQLLLRPKNSNRITQTLGYLVSGHIAGLIGTLRYIGGLERGIWKRVGEEQQ